MQNGLQQWAAAYLTSTDQGEPVLFGKVRVVIKGMQEAGKLNEIIFSQLLMIIQTLKVLNTGISDTFDSRVKKMLALLYNDNIYLTKLVEQINELISQTKQHVQARGGIQNVQPQRTVRRGPPAGQSIC
jgi:hypothetical protein